MLPKAFLCHQVPARFRVRVPDRRGDHAYFAKVKAGLEQNAAAVEVTTNPATGSVLVLHSGDRARLLDHAETTGLFLCTRGRPPPTTIVDWLDRLDRFDTEVLWERLDRNPQRAATAFFMLAMFQVMRGSVLPSAGTLLGEAMRILRKSAETNAQKRASDS